MLDPNQSKDPSQHPLIEEVANWVIDLTDGAEVPQKRNLTDTKVPGKAWTDIDGMLNIPIGLHRTNADGTLSILAAKSSQEGGTATLERIPVNQAA